MRNIVGDHEGAGAAEGTDDAVVGEVVDVCGEVGN